MGIENLVEHLRQGPIYLGGPGVPRPPNNFSDFVLQNVTKLVLHFTFAAIPICPGNKLWSIYELLPDCTSALPGFHFGFELKNNYVIIDI